MLAAMPIRNLKTITTPMRQQQEQLRTLLEGTGAAVGTLADQPLADQIKVFERIERGAVDRATADPRFVRDVEDAVEQLLLVLYRPLDGRPFMIPRDAWNHSPLMRLLASVTYWLYQDDLITMAEAARLLYGASDNAVLGRIRRGIERGEVRHYWRPDREHKQRATLVRRSEVQAWKQAITSRDRAAAEHR